MYNPWLKRLDVLKRRTPRLPFRDAGHSTQKWQITRGKNLHSLQHWSLVNRWTYFRTHQKIGSYIRAWSLGEKSSPIMCMEDLNHGCWSIQWANTHFLTASKDIHDEWVGKSIKLRGTILGIACLRSTASQSFDANSQRQVSWKKGQPSTTLTVVFFKGKNFFSGTIHI